MKPSLERLVALAATTGFRVETLEKAIRLGDIVADVGRHPLLSPALALKGGSALNLCFGEPRRYSIPSSRRIHPTSIRGVCAGRRDSIRSRSSTRARTRARPSSVRAAARGVWPPRAGIGMSSQRR